MRDRQQGSSRFVKGLLIYILIFALLAAGALLLLRSYLAAYEQSRPAAAVRSYLSACEKGRLGYGWGRSLGELDSRMMDEKEARAWAVEKLKSAAVHELPGGGEREKRFALRDEDGVSFLTLTLRAGEEGRWGFRRWEIAEEDCDLSAYTHSAEALIPETYSVRVDGVVLGEESVVEKGIGYELLEPFEDYVKDTPKLVRCACGPFLGEGKVEILDEKGRVVPEEEQTEQHYLSNCSAAQEEELHEFALRYLNAYLPYAGDLYRSGLAFYGELSQMIVTGGELEQRLILARSGFGFGNTNSIRILKDELRFAMDFGDGHYLADVYYRTETEGLHGLVEEDNQVRLLILERDGRYYTEAMVNY